MIKGLKICAQSVVGHVPIEMRRVIYYFLPNDGITTLKSLGVGLGLEIYRMFKNQTSHQNCMHSVTEIII